MKYNVAVVGATGNVGREILHILAERKFPINNLYALASENSVGKKVSFGDTTVEIKNLADFDFSLADIALFSAGAKISAEYAPKAAEHATVIDNTSHFRMHENVPLIVTEVNIDSLNSYKNTNIIANPNCAVMQLVVALKPLHDICSIERIVITTLQSVSGAGTEAMDELFNQTKARFMGDKTPSKVFPKQIAFNILPHIGDFDEKGNTAEELKIAQEIQKILSPNIKVSATCIRIPVFVGHSESVNVEFKRPISAQTAREILETAPGVILMDDPEAPLNYITPIECVGDDYVYVSRIREDASTPNCLNLWIVSDNLRKGAALNAVQIAEEIVKNYT
jgi:aspartate-semialdehyde dehydrogenase